MFAGLIHSSASSATANTINVTTSADGIDFLHCTLRRAIENHNAHGQLNSQCESGSASDVILTTANMDLGDPLPAIDDTLEIQRNSRACGMMRDAAYLTINPGAKLTLNGVGMSSNGSHDISMIDNNGGTLVIKAFSERCLFSNHGTSNRPDSGGVIFNRNNGSVTIQGAEFSGSEAKSAGGAIYNASGTITIGDSGDAKTAFFRNQAFRGGAIFNNGTLNIASNNFSLSFNRSDADVGGGIYNSGSLTIARGTTGKFYETTLAFNTAHRGGGAIFSDNNAKLSIDRAFLHGNSSDNGSGGALVVFKQNASITGSTFRDNSARFFGGSIYGSNQCTLNIAGSTFAHDVAHNGGSGIHVDALSDLRLINSTLLGNAKREGLIVASGASAEVINSTLVTAVIGTQPIDFSNSILFDVICQNVLDQGENLQSHSSGCPASIPVANPMLDPKLLEQNGGPTPTIALRKGSPAIDAISIPSCTDQDGVPVTTDQRGFKRPANVACDIGAFEFGAKP